MQCLRHFGSSLQPSCVLEGDGPFTPRRCGSWLLSAVLQLPGDCNLVLTRIFQESLRLWLLVAGQQLDLPDGMMHLLFLPPKRPCWVLHCGSSGDKVITPVTAAAYSSCALGQSHQSPLPKYLQDMFLWAP